MTPTDLESRSWWLVRWRIFRAPSTAPDGRFWAIAEITCASVTLTTLAVAVAALIAGTFMALPWWVHGWPLQILLAGSVGYGTNFLAVQMLFKPKDPFTGVPMRWIWRQGLIPAKQEEIAAVVGEEVATKLLTPEAIVDEMADIIEVALEDRETVERLQAAVQPLVQKHLPEILRRFLPETLAAVQAALEESLPTDRLKETILQIIDDWFKTPRNRDALVDFLLAFFKERTDEIVALLKTALKRYKKSSGWRDLTISTGTAARLIDWRDYERALRRQLKRPKSRRWATNIVADFSREVHALADRLLKEEWLSQIKTRTGEMALGSIEELAEQSLVPRITGLLETDRFRRYVLDDLIPYAKPKLVDWIKDGHMTPILERFDVQGRVQSAAASLEVEELEIMANRVGALHLGAIQVLGYGLGLMAGVLLALLGTVR